MGVKEPSPHHSHKPAEPPPWLSHAQDSNVRTTLLELAHSARDHGTRGPSTAPPVSQQASPWAQTRWMPGTGRASCRPTAAPGPEAALHATAPHATGVRKPPPLQPPCSLEVQATPLEMDGLGWGGTGSAGGAESRQTGEHAAIVVAIRAQAPQAHALRLYMNYILHSQTQMLLSTYKSHRCKEWNPAYPGVQHLSPADTRGVVTATMEKAAQTPRGG